MSDEKATCDYCGNEFLASELDFMKRCEGCFRSWVPSDAPILHQSTGNPHNSKETKAYVERLEKKRWTSQGTDHNYTKRTYV